MISDLCPLSPNPSRQGRGWEREDINNNSLALVKARKKTFNTAEALLFPLALR
jgi:hypothetical protein